MFLSCQGSVHLDLVLASGLFSDRRLVLSMRAVYVAACLEVGDRNV